MSAPLRILIADDHESFRAMLKSLLQTLGAEVVECRDGREAVQRFSECAPDWVLMDIEMPQLDGLSATREITTLNPQARVVMITQHDDADLRAEANRAGAVGYIRKDNLLELPPLLQRPSEQALPPQQGPGVTGTQPDRWQRPGDRVLPPQ